MPRDPADLPEPMEMARFLADADMMCECGCSLIEDREDESLLNPSPTAATGGTAGFSEGQALFPSCPALLCLEMCPLALFHDTTQRCYLSCHNSSVYRFTARLG